MTEESAVFYNRDGQPISFHEWLELLPAAAQNVIRETIISGDPHVRVSTIFLGVSDEHPPLIYETFVRGGLLGDSHERWPTEAAAEIGHDAWVLRAQAAQGGQ